MPPGVSCLPGVPGARGKVALPPSALGWWEMHTDRSEQQLGSGNGNNGTTSREASAEEAIVEWVIQEPGDCVFVPNGVWHSVVNLEPNKATTAAEGAAQPFANSNRQHTSVAITQNFIDSTTYRGAMDVLAHSQPALHQRLAALVARRRQEDESESDDEQQ